MARAASRSARPFSVSSCLRIITRSPRASARPEGRHRSGARRREQDSREQPCSFLGLERGIGHRGSPGKQGDLLVGREGDETEDRHEALAGGELLDPSRPLVGAASGEVVEQVVAVGGEPELAKPGEDGVWWERRRRDRAMQPQGGASGSISSQGSAIVSLRRCCAPVLADGHVRRATVPEHSLHGEAMAARADHERRGRGCR